MREVSKIIKKNEPPPPNVKASIADCTIAETKAKKLKEVKKELKKKEIEDEKKEIEKDVKKE